MRNCLKSLLFSLGLSVCVSVSAQAACEEPQFDAFGAEGWQVEPPQYYPQAGLGFSYAFNSPGAAGTLYVYDMGLSSEEPRDWRAQLNQAISDIYRIYDTLDQQIVVSDSYKIPQEILSELTFANEGAFLFVSLGETHKITIATLGVVNGCFHKFRYTQDVSSNSEQGLLEGFQRFVPLVHAVEDDLSASGYFQK